MELIEEQHLKSVLTKAVAYHRDGKLQQAEQLYTSILSSFPEHTQTLYLLGVLQLERGAYSHGLEILQRVLSLEPEHMHARYSLGRASEALGRYDDAEKSFRACLENDPRHADAWLSLGSVQQARGLYREAGESYQKVLEIDGKSYKALANLGSVYSMLGSEEMAERCTKKAASLRPDDAAVLCNLAVIYKGQGKLALALETYERAYENDPQMAEALVGKANILEKMGKVEPAFEIIHSLVEDGNANTNAAITFATLADRFGRTDQALDLVQNLLDRETIPAEPRCRLLFTKAKLLDSMDKYNHAFEAAAAANDLVPRSFDQAAHARRVDKIIEIYSKENMGRLARASNDSQLPVFVVGMPRSGKSLTEQVVASHPQVFGTGELPYIDRTVRSLAEIPGMEGGYPDCVGSIDRFTLDLMADSYLDKLRERGGNAARVLDTMPYNFLLLGFIAQLVPKARVIHCVRDPIDTCLACYFKDFRYGNPYTSNLVKLGEYYRAYAKLMRHWHDVLDIPILDVRYEELVADVPACSRKIIDFLDLEWDSRCLRYYQPKSVVNAASHELVREPLSTNWVGRWRHYERQLYPLIETLGAPD